MRILILSDDFLPRSFGGGGVIATWQAVELARRGHDVTVITTVQEYGLPEKINQDGFIIHQIYSNYPSFFRDYVSFYNPQTVFKVKKILKDFGPDVVYIHNVHIHLSYKTITLAKSFSKAVFLTAHDTMSVHLAKLYPEMTLSPDGKRVFDYKVSMRGLFKEFGFRVNPLRKLLIKYYFKKLNKIFAVSNALAESLRQNGISNIEVIHNGIDLKAFSADQNRVDEFKDKYDLHDKKVMFFGGRISIAKGGRVAVDLLTELAKTMPNICLMIVGQKDNRVNELMLRARASGVEDKVRFTGWLNRTEIISAYCASDIVLVPSLYLDPFPTINLEAMASGKPVVGTCFGGTSEAVADGHTGFIVNPNDFKSVVDRARSLIEDAELSEKFGKAGQARVLKEFQLSSQVDKLERAYSVTVPRSH